MRRIGIRTGIIGGLPILLASIFHEDLSLCEVEAELARSVTVGMVDGPHCPDRLAGLCAVG
jgi:hypothetical protein